MILLPLARAVSPLEQEFCVFEEAGQEILVAAERGQGIDRESSANDLSHAFPGPRIGQKPGGLGALDEDACERFHSSLGQLGGRPADGFVRRPSSPWRGTIAFHRPTDDGASFNARTTSMFFLPARSSRPEARRRASCSFGSKCSLQAYPYATTCNSVHYSCDGHYERSKH